MPRDENLIGTHIGRDESPEIEFIIQEEIGIALAVVLSDLGLYQKKKIDFERIDKFLKSIQSTNKLVLFQREFSKRPFIPISPDLSEDKLYRARYFCGVGDQPLGSSEDELNLAFPLPSIKIWCRYCKDDVTFKSVGSIWHDGFLEYFPKIKEDTEQIFVLYYKCSQCNDNIITYLIKRIGLSLHLCGRSKRRRINVSEAIPRKLRNIIEDALSAANENDIYAGFYHLRTFCEHYMKSCLDLSIEHQITGDELSKQYNANLDDRMTDGMPSMSSLYSTASKYMHNRAGERKGFDKILRDINSHLIAKDLFGKYSLTD